MIYIDSDYNFKYRKLSYDLINFICKFKNKIDIKVKYSVPAMNVIRKFLSILFNKSNSCFKHFKLLAYFTL